MSLKVPAINRTPLGACTQASAVAAAIVSVLDSTLPWWQHQTPEAKGAALVVLTPVVGYLAGWLKVVLARGQQVHLQLTASPLPTVQVAEAPAPVPAPASPGATGTTSP